MIRGTATQISAVALVVARQVADATRLLEVSLPRFGCSIGETVQISLDHSNLRSKVLEVGRLRLQKNRDYDYLTILSLFEVIGYISDTNLTKSNQRRNRKSDYRFLFFRIVIANPNYQLLILSNRPTSTRHAAGRRPYGYLRNRIWALLTQIVEGGNRF